jgi:hypothetical protein
MMACELRAARIRSPRRAGPGLAAPGAGEKAERIVSQPG